MSETTPGLTWADREEAGRLAQELNCIGYFGFGGGYWIGKQAQAPATGAVLSRKGSFR